MPSDSTASILTLVNQTLELPTLPEVLVRLNDVISDPDVSVEAVAEIVSSDPAISANILRLVNSAYYGLQVRVSTVSLAISIMGFTMIRRIALKAAVFDVFGAKSRESTCLDPEAFWKHSIFTGVAARVLGSEAAKLAEHHPEDLYIGGLLHDIGKLILADRAGAAFAGAIERAKRGDVPLRRIEVESLGFDHADVGSVLAIKWLLPEELAIATRYHHAPMEDPFHRPLSCLIHLADHLAGSAGYASTPGVVSDSLELDVYEEIGLDPLAVEGLLMRVREEFDAVGLPW